MGEGLFLLFSSQQITRTQDLVLVGGGHSHVIAIKKFGMEPLYGAQVTLISSSTDTPYSGMLPGLIAGHHDYDDAHIDLMRLCQWAGVRFIQAEVVGIDRQEKWLSLLNRPAVSYDVVSIDVGAVQNLSSVAGASDHVIPVKPISEFWEKWSELKRGSLEGERIAMVGGGAGSIELVLAMAKSVSTKVQFDLYCGGLSLLSENTAFISQSVMRTLERFGVNVYLNAWVREVTKNSLLLKSNERHAFDHAFWCTEAAPMSWLVDSDLSLDQNRFVATKDTFQSLDDDDVFAVGDCATQVNQPRPKAGVFAVRQGPILAKNLRAHLLGQQLKYHRAQKRFLSILSLGSNSAIAIWDPFFVSAKWVWHWKNFIDRSFMKKFSELPLMEGYPKKRSVEIVGVGPAQRQPFCGGCGAKVSPDILSEVLSHLMETVPDHCQVSNEDTQQLNVPNQTLWQSIDALREIISDPWLMGQLAANHALSDLYASGLQPHSVQALITLPFAAPKLQARELTQVLLGALTVFKESDCVLVGGHSMQGAELQIAFSVNGVPNTSSSSILRKQGLSDGDELIITKPLGIGVIFAAHMQLLAQGKDIESALISMTQSNSKVSQTCLDHGVKCATDITGFGLAVHLNEMLLPHQGAIIYVESLPSFDGALSHMSKGIRSTSHDSNRRSAEPFLSGLTKASLKAELLFDPQTCGGILFGAHPAICDKLKYDLAAHGTSYYELGKVIQDRNVIKLC